MQEVASLNIMAEKLEEDKAVLEEQLVEARRAQADICKAGKQLAAAETTIRESTMMSMSNGGNTPDTDVSWACYVAFIFVRSPEWCVNSKAAR